MDKYLNTTYQNNAEHLFPNKTFSIQHCLHLGSQSEAIDDNTFFQNP
ncbi:MAG: hypothetical protein K6G31_05565 [Paludibacteraceae bacterium]|nr:hypothetical protein [Paludibacteraceae bacterium]